LANRAEVAQLAAGLAWARRAIEGNWTITDARPLTGGVTGAVVGLDLSGPGNSMRRLVLKLYRPDPSEPDSAWREARILKLLESTELPLPRVVAIDRYGAVSGWPALLMTRMPGRRRMRPREPEPWLQALAELGRRIHSLAISHDALPRYLAWGVDDPLPVPPWWTKPEIWKRAVEIFRGPAPEEPRVFIHRDFHPGNVLWTGSRPSAIVDWLHGCLGPASVDVAHCGLNLWLDLGPEVAAHWPIVHPYWEIADALSWPPEPEEDGLARARRYESFVTGAVARLS
jgi:aminoglycoside phosphotransferase (APT) family kinase protein